MSREAYRSVEQPKCERCDDAARDGAVFPRRQAGARRLLGRDEEIAGQVAGAAEILRQSAADDWFDQKFRRRVGEAGGAHAMAAVLFVSAAFAAMRSAS